MALGGVYAGGDPVGMADRDGYYFEIAWDLANVAMGLASLGSNPAEGNYGAAAVDAVGVAADIAGAAVPVVPSGAGTAIRASRAADKAGGLAKGAGASKGVDAAADAAKVAPEGGGGRFIVDPKGNTLIEPPGGKTVGDPTGTWVETQYPNGSPAQQLHGPHKNYPEPHGHGFAEGAGRNQRGQSLDPQGNPVPENSPDAHWEVKK